MNGSAPRAKRRPLSLDRLLFGLSLAVFLASRLIGLERFPIFFFCDEAIQTVRAEELVHNHFRDNQGHLLPTYFENGGYLNLGASVYLQVIPYSLFGKSVFVTRAVSVAVAFLGAIAVGLILKNVFRIRFWWAGVLMLSVAPAWFLHSRTAFETVEAAAFYAWFLYFYLRYRLDRPVFLFPALLFGALAFYGYNGSQPVVVATGALLLVADAPYHWRNRKIALWAIPFLILLVFPYGRFLRAHPGELHSHLEERGSYWVDQRLTLGQKLGTFSREYAKGFSPAYWFSTEPTVDLIRHRMKGYGFLPWAFLPLGVAGAVICLWRIRSPAHRTLLIFLLAAPVSGALVRVGITRLLTLVVIAALLAALSLGAVLSLLSRRVPSAILAVGLFLALSADQTVMLADALKNGPTWFRDYGLYGLQYGAKQVFGAVRSYRALHPDSRVYVSSIWTNGADDVCRFFLGDDPMVDTRTVDYYILKSEAPLEEDLQVMTAAEYERVAGDPKFVIAGIEERIAYPDGSPGFVMAHLKYSPNVGTILQAEYRERQRLVEENVRIDSELVHVAHSRLDTGQMGNVFDGRQETLIRTMQINPAVLDFTFPVPRVFRSVHLCTASMDVDLKVRVFPERGGPEEVVEQTFTGLPMDPCVEFPLPAGITARRVRLEIRDPRRSERGEIHVREISFR